MYFAIVCHKCFLLILHENKMFICIPKLKTSQQKFMTHGIKEMTRQCSFCVNLSFVSTNYQGTSAAGLCTSTRSMVVGSLSIEPS